MIRGNSPTLDGQPCNSSSGGPAPPAPRWPAVHQQRRRPAPAAKGVPPPDAARLEAVQNRLGRAPVVGLAPMAGQLAGLGEPEAVLRARVGRLVRPAGGVEPPPQIF